MTMPQAVVEVAFGVDPVDESLLWVDVSPYVEWQYGVRIARRRSHELDQVGPGTMRLVLLNDGRFTAGRTSSPYYPNVLINRPIRLRARYPASANLLPAGQARSGTGTLFSASTGTLTSTISVVPPGQSASIQWAATLAGGSLLRVGTTSTSSPTDQAIGVREGLPYTFRCQARRGAANTATLAPAIRWYDVTGSTITDSTGAAVALTTTFAPLTVSATAPAGATWARLTLQSTASSGGAVDVYASAWQFEQAASASTWASSDDYIRYRGYVDNWPTVWQNGVLGLSEVTCTDQMKLLGRARLDAALTDSQLSGARMAALLASADITDTSHIDPGLSVLRLSGDEANQAILQLIRRVEVSEAGLFFIRKDGAAAFHDRGRRQSPPLTVLILEGDQCGPDLSFTVDDTLLINDVTVTAADDSTYQIVGAASAGRYGRYSASVDTLLSPADLPDRANYLFLAYEEPLPRIGQISIEAHSQPGLWPDLLGAEIGDRMLVTDLPDEAPSDPLQLWLEGIAEDITDQRWVFTLDSSPAAGFTFILDDPDYGVLDSNYLGW